MRFAVRGSRSVAGWPWLEILVVLVVAALVIGVVAGRVQATLERAEKSAMELTLVNMRSALRLEQARRILNHQPMDDLQGMNPLSLLQSAPPAEQADGLGALSASLVRPGWSFNAATATLQYRPQRTRHLQLEAGEGDSARLAWRVSGVGQRNDGLTRAGAVDLRLLTPYRWFDSRPAAVSR